MQGLTRLARQAKALRPSPAEAARLKIDLGDLMKRMSDHSHRLAKMRSTLDRGHEQRGEEGPSALQEGKTTTVQVKQNHER